MNLVQDRVYRLSVWIR